MPAPSSIIFSPRLAKNSLLCFSTCVQASASLFTGKSLHLYRSSSSISSKYRVPSNVSLRTNPITMTATEDKPYVLYYWPMLPGRGEFIRFILEKVGAPYIDVGRGEDGMNVVSKNKNMTKNGCTHFAPPIMELPDGTSLSQTAVISAYLAEQYDLMPEGIQKYSAMQLAETIHDMVSEIHDVHHPVSSALRYEDQMPEAKRAATNMVNERIPKFFTHFERSIEEYGQGKGSFMFGEKMSYVDLALAQLLRGIEHAFPSAFDRVKHKYPALKKVGEAVMEDDKLKGYLASDRCIAFCEDGIFRYYQELDL